MKQIHPVTFGRDFRVKSDKAESRDFRPKLPDPEETEAAEEEPAAKKKRAPAKS